MKKNIFLGDEHIATINTKSFEASDQPIDEGSDDPDGWDEAKEAHRRVEYLEHKIAKKLCRIEGVQSKAAFMVDLFGRHGPKELQRLSMIYPEVMK